MIAALAAKFVAQTVKDALTRFLDVIHHNGNLNLLRVNHGRGNEPHGVFKT